MSKERKNNLIFTIIAFILIGIATYFIALM
jgi:hypothetical protein